MKAASNAGFPRWPMAVLMLVHFLDKPSVATATRTRLSVMDPHTKEYISIADRTDEQLWRDLLKRPDSATREIDSSSRLRGLDRTSATPLLTLDKTVLENHHESLTVYWDEVAVEDTDVLALYCGNDENDDASRTGSAGDWGFLDAATIAQARATSLNHHHWAIHESLTKDSNILEETTTHRRNRKLRGHRILSSSWFIPKFPSSIRASWCEFVLHRIERSSFDDDGSTDNDENKLYTVHTLGKSPRLDLQSTKIPTNVHLALTRDPTVVLLQFTTGSAGVPIALFGTSSNPSDKVEGTSTTFGVDDLCGAPANSTGYFCDPGQLHTIVLRRLQPSTTYHYKVGVTFGQGIVWREQILQFQSPPANRAVTGSTSHDPYSFVVYANQGCPSLGWGMGGLWTTMGVAKEVQDHGLHAVHHIGGLSYARGAGHIWDEWLSLTEAFATRVPLMIAVGNDEYDHLSGGFYKDPSGYNRSHGYMPPWGNYGDDSGGECGVPVAKRFQMPSTGNGVFWYSYDSANLHTIVLSSEHDLSSHSEQNGWLLQDLRSVNRTLTPWVIVELHRPLYNNQALWPDNDVGIGLRHTFETILKDHKVDLVLSGHYPTYFRSCSGLFESTCDNGGPTHVTIGSGGALLEVTNLYEADWAVKNLQGVFGFARVRIYNDTSLEFDFLQASSPHDNTTGEVLDHFWIHK